jgi:hypothetical protein
MSKFIWQWSFQILLVLVGFGADFMPNIQTWIPSITIWSVAFIWGVISVIWWLRIRQKIPTGAKPTTSILVKTDEVLKQIHERMLELKDKAVRQYYLTHSLKEFLNLHDTVMSTYNKNTDLKNLEKSLKGKRLSKDIGKRRSQLDNLFEQLKPISPTVQSLDEFVKFTNKIDRLAEIPRKEYQYRGLDIRRNEDKKWKKLFSELQSIKAVFADNTLNDMIEKYIQWSYSVSGLIWLTDLLREMSVADMPTKYLESEAYNPAIKADELIARLRGKIIERLKEVQAMNDKNDKTIIKDTKVELEADKVDEAIGMDIDNVQTELSDVQIDVKAKNTKEATGLKITAQDTKFALSSKVIQCSCGNVLRSITTCGYEPVIKCPRCGKEYRA